MQSDINLLFDRVRRIELLLAFIAGAQLFSIANIVINFLK